MFRSTGRRTLVGSRGPLRIRFSVSRLAAVSLLVAGVVVLGGPVALASGSPSPYTTLAVALGSRPFGVAVDETTDTIYAANSISSTVSVIDGATNTVTATINVGTSPLRCGGR